MGPQRSSNSSPNDISKRHQLKFLPFLFSLLIIMILSEPSFSSVKPCLLTISTDWMLLLELIIDLHSLLKLNGFVVQYIVIFTLFCSLKRMIVSCDMRQSINFSCFTQIQTIFYPLQKTCHRFTSSRPLLVSLYSTLGEISLYDNLSNTPLFSNSFNRVTKVLLLIPFKVYP